jgi:uncharacterized protein YwgA
MMERLKRAALLGALIDKLRRKGSWCGETHIQKAVLFLQTLVKVPLGYQYILYKHGPYSFELRDELTSFRADDLLSLEPKSPYGPRIALTNRAETLKRHYSKTLAQYDDRIDFIADKLGNKPVIELERLATALFITLGHPDWPLEHRAREISEIKPHIDKAVAAEAVEQIEQMKSDVRANLF